jgi:hypothetical protein
MCSVEGLPGLTGALCAVLAALREAGGTGAGGRAGVGVRYHVVKTADIRLPPDREILVGAVAVIGVCKVIVFLPYTKK